MATVINKLILHCTSYASLSSLFTGVTLLLLWTIIVKPFTVTGFMAGPGLGSDSHCEVSGGSNMLCLPMDNGSPTTTRTANQSPRPCPPGATGPPGGTASTIYPMANPYSSGQRANPADSVLYCNLCLKEDRRFQVSS